MSISSDHYCWLDMKGSCVTLNVESYCATGLGATVWKQKWVEQHQNCRLIEFTPVTKFGRILDSTNFALFVILT